MVGSEQAADGWVLAETIAAPVPASGHYITTAKQHHVRQITNGARGKSRAAASSLSDAYIQHLPRQHVLRHRTEGTWQGAAPTSNSFQSKLACV